jgi:GNAT superfamily N-acetyltransferase
LAIVITDTPHPIRLHAARVEHALRLSREAGWNQNAADWLVFFRHGTVLGFTIGDRLAATAAALPYGDDFGWISMVLVSAEWRGQGLGHRLVGACTSILGDCGRAALLDATPAGAGIYTSLGFVPLCSVERWEGDGSGVATASASANLALDRFAFGADRRFLLEDFLSRRGSLAFQSAHGFAILRQGAAASHLGPIAGEPEGAPALAAEAIRAAPGPVLVDVLDAGSGIIPKLIAHGFRRRRCFTRMALGLTALPGNPAQLLAAAGPEFG